MRCLRDVVIPGLFGAGERGEEPMLTTEFWHADLKTWCLSTVSFFRMFRRSRLQSTSSDALTDDSFSIPTEERQHSSAVSIHLKILETLLETS